MIGVVRGVFDQAADELYDLHVAALDTPFKTDSPCIVDIDEGKIMEIIEYKAIRDLDAVMESNPQTNTQRNKAYQAQE